MEIIDSILGNASEPGWEARLQGSVVDWLELTQWDARKTRFRKETISGRAMAVALERGQYTIDEQTKEKGEFDYGKNVL